MKSSNGKDMVGTVLLVLSLVGGVIMLFYKPFGFGPPSFLAALIGSSMTTRNRRFGLGATGIVTLCFLIGAAIAVWDSRSLY